MQVQTAIDSLFMLFCTFLLLVVVLGIAIFYSGLIQRRSSFSMLAIPPMLSSVIFLDWFIWGYSLCYGSSSNHFIGSMKFVVLRQLKSPEEVIYSTPRGEILSIIHVMFNALMKIVCVAITFPACIAERGRVMPMLVFVFLWSAIIYNPVTYWFWNKNGWLSTELNMLPVLDFAGGNCIHVVSGFTALAYSYILGPRNPKIVYEYRSSSNSNMIVGMCFILMGWCGFIAGCDFKFSGTSFYIMMSTLLSACTAGVVWTAMDYYNSAIPLEGEDEEIELSNLDSNSTRVPRSVAGSDSRNSNQGRKLSMISFSSGVICGLVVFTPCGGYIASDNSFWKSIVCGVFGGVCGNMATRLKYYFKIDDSLDIFAIHGVCGIVGSLLVGLFADKDVYASNGGWVAQNWIQFGYQVLGSVVTAIYVFVVSLVLLYALDMIPGLHLRIDKNFNRRMRERERHQHPEEGLSIEEDHMERLELMGSDWYEFNGEYSMDFMEFIKVIDPQDYTEELVGQADEMGFARFETDASQIRKREMGNG